MKSFNDSLKKNFPESIIRKPMTFENHVECARLFEPEVRASLVNTWLRDGLMTEAEAKAVLLAAEQDCK
jgi:hypothetical protein